MLKITDLPEDLRPLVRRNALSITNTSFEGDCQRLVAAMKMELERAAAEEHKRLEAEALGAQRRENERLINTRREEDRLEAERQEAERGMESAAEQHQDDRQSASNGKTIPQSAAPPQDVGPTQAEVPPIVQSKASKKQNPSAHVAQLVVVALIWIAGLIWFATVNHNRTETILVKPKQLGYTGEEAQVAPTPTPTPTAAPSQKSTTTSSPLLSDAAVYIKRGTKFFQSLPTFPPINLTRLSAISPKQSGWSQILVRPGMMKDRAE